MLNHLRTSFILLIVFTILTGFIYPLTVTVFAHSFFPWQAKGSIISIDNKPIGSALIGQYVDDPKYLWGRPSATTPFPYNASNSAGSNLGPSNPDLLNTVKGRIALLYTFEEGHKRPIPIDLVTSSASGLDPDISPWAALFQMPRIAKARNLNEAELTRLLEQHIQRRTWIVLGEPRVNVLEFNLALDHLPGPNPEANEGSSLRGTYER